MAPVLDHKQSYSNGWSQILADYPSYMVTLNLCNFPSAFYVWPTSTWMCLNGLSANIYEIKSTSKACWLYFIWWCSGLNPWSCASQTSALPLSHQRHPSLSKVSCWVTGTHQDLIAFFSFFFFFCALIGWSKLEPKALYMLGRCPATNLHLQICFFFFLILFLKWSY